MQHTRHRRSAAPRDRGMAMPPAYSADIFGVVVSRGLPLGAVVGTGVDGRAHPARAYSRRASSALRINSRAPSPVTD